MGELGAEACEDRQPTIARAKTPTTSAAGTRSLDGRPFVGKRNYGSGSRLMAPSSDGTGPPPCSSAG